MLRSFVSDWFCIIAFVLSIAFHICKQYNILITQYDVDYNMLDDQRSFGLNPSLQCFHDDFWQDNT